MTDPTPPKLQPKGWLPLAGVLILAAGVRCYGLDAPILSHDESFSWRLTQYSASELWKRTAADVHPPLYYLCLKAWSEIFGESLWSLRGLSVLFGVLAVLVLYFVSLEVLEDQLDSAQKSWTTAHTGALFAALLLAVSSAQVEASRTARMYSLGVFLAALTAWLLWRACRAQHGRWYWWTAYGTAVALFCYTHNYAFFTLFGQGLFVLGSVLFSRRTTSMANAGKLLSGFSYAGLLAFVLYLPWIPALFEQARQVKLNYWIEQVNIRILERTLFTFGTGVPYDGYEPFSLLWLVLLAGAIVLAVWGSKNAACFFLLQAFAPLVLSAAVSLASGRSIFQERLFVFAQLSLIGFWGVVWSVMPGWLERLAFAVAVLLASSTAVATNLTYLDQRPAAVGEAARFLKTTVEAGDEVWTSGPWELNQLRYYLAQAGATDLKVRFRHPRPGKGHMVHLSSVLDEEVIWTDTEPVQPPKRLWVAGNELVPGKQMRQVLSKELYGQGGYTLRLFVVDARE